MISEKRIDVKLQWHRMPGAVLLPVGPQSRLKMSRVKTLS